MSPIYFVVPADLLIFRPADMAWMEQEEGTVLRKATTDDAYECTVVMTPRPLGEIRALKDEQ